MRIRSLLVFAAAAALILSGCEKTKEQPSAAEITIKSESSVVVASAGESKTVTFVATREWTATVSDAAKSWLSVSPDKGKASSKEQSITVSATENAGTDRSGNVTISILSGGKAIGSKTVTFSQEGVQQVTYTSIADLRSLAPTGEDVVQIVEGTVIKGVVISNVELNNLNSKKIVYLQDETAAVQLYFDTNASFSRGDEVAADLTGASLKLYSGQLEVDGAKLQLASKLGTGTVAAKTVTIADFLANKYEAQYVALEGVQVAKADIDKTWVLNDNATSINFEDAEGNTFVVRSSKYSSYKDEKVPSGSGTIKGISTIYNGTLQLVFTEAADYAGLTGERIQPPYTETTIADILAGTATGGVIVEGFVMAAGNNAFVINEGGDKSLYVYDKNVAAPAARTKVKVQGKVATYGDTNLIQLNEIELSESTKDFNVTAPTPKKLDAAGVDAYAENWSELVAIQGVLKKSGNYLNIEIGGDRVGSIVACPGTDALVDGKTYGIIGFFAGVSGSSSKYFNILPAVISEIDTREPCVKIFEEAGYKMEDYTRLAIDWTHNGYWNSTDGTNHSKIITGQSNSSQFAATPQYHRSALPVGSVLVVQGATAEVSNGWMYRPEGWQSKGSKNNGKRPDNVTGKASPVVVVDDAWWGTSFNYRAFNVARVGNPNLTEAQQEELEHIFGVFIPKPLASTDEMLRKGGYDPANFTKLEFTYTKDAFYNSTSDTNSNLVTTGNNVVQFVATSIVEKAQIPNGSVIVVNYGYQYRPEGWQTLGTKNTATRPANVGNNVVVVDDAWWGNYNYRAFNLAKFGNPSMTEASERDAVIAAFAVYVPKN